MARRKVIWHIGPADRGTSFLAEALDARASELASLGVAVPTGAWHEIEDQIWRHKGVSVLSTPDIARADADEIALRLVGLRDLDVHLVLLTRDLPTQVYAAWQDALQHGSSTPLKKYVTRLLDPTRDHWQAEDFWAGRDLAGILPAFTRAFHADRVHVIATDADPDAVWSSFLTVAGIAEVERPDVYTPPSLKADLDPERVLDITTGWAKLIADRGFELRGSLISASADAAAGEAAGKKEQLEALAEVLTEATAEIARLRAEVEVLRAENERLDSKRLKHKRRVERLRAELTAID
ncbi:MAG: cell division protein ZapB [Marmoricola sp.]